VTYPAATGDSRPVPQASPAHAEERSAVIDLQAIRHNVRRVAAVASPARVMAVVKADAYGHGAVPVARAALSAGATWLGTAHISEALALRAAGIEAPLLAWLHTPESNFAAAVAAGIDIGCSGWELERIVAAAREQERPARVHLKVDTGLGRNGATLEAWDSLVGEAMEYQDQGLLRVVGIFSHLAVADEPERPETDDQLTAFREALAIAQDAGVDPEVRHLADSLRIARERPIVAMLPLSRYSKGARGAERSAPGFATWWADRRPRFRAAAPRRPVTSTPRIRSGCRAAPR